MTKTLFVDLLIFNVCRPKNPTPKCLSTLKFSTLIPFPAYYEQLFRTKKKVFFVNLNFRLCAKNRRKDDLKMLVKFNLEGEKNLQKISSKKKFVVSSSDIFCQFFYSTPSLPPSLPPSLFLKGHNLL
jgi:hypothetical protein